MVGNQEKNVSTRRIRQEIMDQLQVIRQHEAEIHSAREVSTRQCLVQSFSSIFDLDFVFLQHHSMA